MRLIISDFGTPFLGLTQDQKLSHKELIRVVWFMVTDKNEEAQLYMQLTESTDDTLAIEAHKDIADEERVHVDEFLRL